MKKMKKSMLKTEFASKTDSKGRRLLLCMNSEPDSKYFNGKVCNYYEVASAEAVAILCHRCTMALTDPPAIRMPVEKSDKPKGWKFMGVFVAQDGTVYHKGVEQPALKGTLPVTVIQPKPEKKKLTKQEKEAEILYLGKEIESLKVRLFAETRKGKKAEMIRQLSKANKQLKKLM